MLIVSAMSGSTSTSGFSSGQADSYSPDDAATLASRERDDSSVSLQPVFLFSISRSGSTLVQRILAAHTGVATASEPWVMLPQAYALRERGVDAEYLHRLLPTAIAEFSRSLPGGLSDYEAEVRELALRLYAKASGPEATHFVDKTPPYSLIAAEIIRLFPEAKFVFLWRSPPSVMASMVDTWGPWRPTFMSADLFVGLPRLVAAFEANRERSHAARFEQLAAGDRETWAALTEYLGISFEPEALSSFAEVDLGDRMGDQTGRRRYTTLSSDPTGKWKTTLANPLRREWCRRYLRFLGERRLATMGYSLAELLAELDAVPPSREDLGGDSWRALKTLAKEPIQVRTRNRWLATPNVVRTLLAA